MSVTKFDEKRMYAVRCPSCKLAMNVIGTTLNEEKYIRCMHCKAIGRTANWTKGAYDGKHINPKQRI